MMYSPLLLCPSPISYIYITCYFSGCMLVQSRVPGYGWLCKCDLVVKWSVCNCARPLKRY